MNDLSKFGKSSNDCKSKVLALFLRDKTDPDFKITILMRASKISKK
jgi:hypothetical protein